MFLFDLPALIEPSSFFVVVRPGRCSRGGLRLRREEFFICSGSLFFSGWRTARERGLVIREPLQRRERVFQGRGSEVGTRPSSYSSTQEGVGALFFRYVRVCEQHAQAAPSSPIAVEHDPHANIFARWWFALFPSLQDPIPPMAPVFSKVRFSVL